MLCINNINDINKMKKYYRVNDMINLIEIFPKLSPVIDLTIVKDENDYKKNKKYLETLKNIRVDTSKGRPPIEGIEVLGRKEEFLPTLIKVKEKDPHGVIALFNLSCSRSERYEHYAGICVSVDVGIAVHIEAVGQGFDGREVSKGICTHERYYIPWHNLRTCNIQNFKQFMTYKISQSDYQKTRADRLNFLESINVDREIAIKHVPESYEEIPNFIWLNIIKNILKKLEKNEELLISTGYKHFAIHGHTEGKEFLPWQMFDKSRFI